MITFKQYLKESTNNNNIEAEVINLFKNNEKVDDSMVHALSDRLGVDTHEFEGNIYKLLSDFFHAGKAMNFKGSFDPEQIRMGVKVEMEHTTNPKIAERIAKDHLSEIPDYYTRLAKMEKEAGITESVNTNEYYLKDKYGNYLYKSSEGSFDTTPNKNEAFRFNDNFHKNLVKQLINIFGEYRKGPLSKELI